MIKKIKIKLIKKYIPGANFYIFSDDLDWVKKNLIISEPSTFVDHNPSDQAFQDLRLMSSCKHQIIANSSFSWWGAWLNPNPEKIVIAPEKWFPANEDTSTLLPKDWLSI